VTSVNEASVFNDTGVRGKLRFQLCDLGHVLDDTAGDELPYRGGEDVCCGCRRERSFLFSM
jgi:hypothetical protein